MERSSWPRFARDEEKEGKGSARLVGLWVVCWWRKVTSRRGELQKRAVVVGGKESRWCRGEGRKKSGGGEREKRE